MHGNLSDNSDTYLDGSLYPYGLAAGDAAAPTADDDCHNQYNKQITMFGQTYSSLYVRHMIAKINMLYKAFLLLSECLIDCIYFILFIFSLTPDWCSSLHETI